MLRSVGPTLLGCWQVSARTPGHVLKLETVHFFRNICVALVETISTMCTKIHDGREQRGTTKCTELLS